jgi:hypothetical protein
LQPPLQILRSDEERLGLFFSRLDQTNCGPRWQSREEVLISAHRVKFKSAF